MNTKVINLKVDAATKRQAQRVAERIGFSLSSLLKAYLRQLIYTKRVDFALPEEPSDYLLEMLRESDQDMKAGRYREFSSQKEELEYLDTLIADAKRSGHR